MGTPSGRTGSSGRSAARRTGGTAVAARVPARSGARRFPRWCGDSGQQDWVVRGCPRSQRVERVLGRAGLDPGRWETGRGARSGAAMAPAGVRVGAYRSAVGPDDGLPCADVRPLVGSRGNEVHDTAVSAWMSTGRRKLCRQQAKVPGRSTLVPGAALDGPPTRPGRVCVGRSWWSDRVTRDLPAWSVGSRPSTSTTRPRPRPSCPRQRVRRRPRHARRGGPRRRPSTLVASVHEEFEQTYAERAYAYPEVEERLVPVVDAWRVGWSVDGEPVDVGPTTPPVPTGRSRRTSACSTCAGACCGASCAGPRRRAERHPAQRAARPLTRREVVASRWRVHAHGDVTVTLRPVPGCAHGGQDPGREAPGLVTVSCRHDAEGRPCGSAPCARSAASPSRPRTSSTRRTASARAGTTAAAPPSSPSTCAPTSGWRSSSSPPTRAAPTPTRSRARALRARRGRRRGLGRASSASRPTPSPWSGSGATSSSTGTTRCSRRCGTPCSRWSGVGARRGRGRARQGPHGHRLRGPRLLGLGHLRAPRPGPRAARRRGRAPALAARHPPHACERAAELGLPGAAFPWRTISGRESSGYWPAGTAAFHVASAVALAAVRHVAATHDDELARDVAVDLAVQTARLWAGRATTPPPASASTA